MTGGGAANGSEVWIRSGAGAGTLATGGVFFVAVVIMLVKSVVPILAGVFATDGTTCAH